jgi:hypothetical protein
VGARPFSAALREGVVKATPRPMERLLSRRRVLLDVVGRFTGMPVFFLMFLMFSIN